MRREDDSRSPAAGGPADAAETTGDLKAIRAGIEAADPLLLQPALLMELAVELRSASLAAVDAAERSGAPDTTLELLGGVWHEKGARARQD